MDEQSRKAPSFALWAAGAALGAAAMYLADPEKGRRRRALAADKVRSIAIRTNDAVEVAGRDLRNRAQGVRAKAARALKFHRGADDDEAMSARIRQEIGRVVAHPRAIKIDAHNGHVTLHGPIISHERQQLLDRVQALPGVSALEDRLESHASPAGVPGLQGEGRRRRSASQPRDAWSPSLRAVAALGGSVLGIYGLTRRSAGGLAASALGIGLLTRGIVNRPLRRAATTAAQEFDLHQAIYIDAAPEAVFDIWSRAENFPRFMSNVKQVEDIGDGRTHWVVSGPEGAELEWTAAITESTRPETLAWATEPGAAMRHAGMVHFEPAGEGTRVNLHLSYLPPVGASGTGSAKAFNGDPQRQMDEDLLRMKSYIESGFIPSGESRTDTEAGILRR